jgi:putative oxidoreductase
MTVALRACAPIPLRLMGAIGFLYHGMPKFTPEGHQMFLGMLQGAGIPAPELASWLAAAVEVGGGLLLLVGLMVRLAVIPLIVNMLVAMFTVHLPHGFSFMNMTGMTAEGPTFGMPGFETNLLYISILTALWLTGAGPWSIEARAGSAGGAPRHSG